MQKQKAVKNLQKQKKTVEKCDITALMRDIEKAKKSLESITQVNERNKKEISEIQVAVDSYLNEITRLKEENQKLKETALPKLAAINFGSDKNAMKTIIGQAMNKENKASENSIRGWLRASLEEERQKTKDLENKVSSLELELKRLRS